MTPIEKVRERLSLIETNEAGQFDATCPAHDDNRRSLRVKVTGDGKVLMHCHAGCDTKSVVERVGLKLADLSPSTNGRVNGSTNGKAKRKLGKIVATYPYHDEAGKLLFEVVRFEPKDFRQRQPVVTDDEVSTGLWVWGLSAGQYVQPEIGANYRPARKGETGIELPECRRVLYRLPEILADATKPVVVVEGEKDADRLRNLGFVATTSPGGGGKKKWLPDYTATLAGRDVVVIPDHDRAGQQHAETIANALHGTAASVRVVELDVGEKGDVSDWLDAGHTKAELEARIGAAQPWKPSGKLQIEVTVDEFKVNPKAVEALSRDPDVYSRAGGLVHVIDGDGLRIRGLPAALISEKLTEHAHFFKTVPGSHGDEEQKEQHPPKWCVDAVRDRGEWPGIRSLRSVVEYPVLRPDGTVSEPGYDAATRVIYQTDDPPTIPSNPTPDDAKQAVARLIGVTADFPFAEPVHRATWLAYLLTPVARFAFDGPAPLFVIDANVRGSGKTLLAELVALILTGKPASRLANPKDDEECRKAITSLAIRGERLVLIDNVAGKLGCPSLDAALTGTRWKDRVLGKSEIVDLPLDMTWAASANNVVLGADTARRVAHIRLESPEERPEERDGFTVPNIRRFVVEHRRELLADVLTILRAWHVAERPAGLKSWGSFEGWSNTVRAAVVWLGLPDPAETRTELTTSADREASALATVIDCWKAVDPEGRGVKLADVIKAVREGGNDDLDALRDALLELSPKLKPQSLGMRFHHLHRRFVDGRCLDCKDVRRTKVWFVSSQRELF